MRQSITTKYLGPTNSKGSRIKATARKRSHSFPEQALTSNYGYRSTEEEHCIAAHALAAKLGWSGLWVGGGNVDEDGYVFVNVPGNLTDGEVTHWAAQGAWGMRGRDWFFVEPKAAAE
ncbi:hypothetical protein [Novosphingobium lindaniclasticum]|uniref:Uncharacterized protein n=1 Tax=Novosphingobium lindaniclasticum LE124 TaxID=1096930 RepID=T0HI26_9SPHN|nr:hypothetical protein [Novosphingobium lindaniclasticum]EQB12677.1 hypothetical protein L284_14985 [Novosphingobium lindaniclasticum LE124]